MEPQKLRRKRGVTLTSEGWKKLQDARREAEVQSNSGNIYTLEQLSEQTRLDLSTVAKVLDREAGVDKRTLERFFSAFNLELTKSDYFKPDADEAISAQHSAVNGKHHYQNRTDWGEAVDISIFYGRTEELSKLEQWLLKDRCRLVALLGIGGVGKTSLAAKLVEQIKDKFEYVI